MKKKKSSRKKERFQVNVNPNSVIGREMKYQTALLHEILNEVREQKRSIKEEGNNQGKAYSIEKFYADAPFGDESEKGLKEVTININLSNYEWDKFQRQQFYKELMQYLNNSEERMIFYLCDGEKEDCPRTHCYKNRTGDCKRTSDINHAINFEKKKIPGGVVFREEVCFEENKVDKTTPIYIPLSRLHTEK